MKYAEQTTVSSERSRAEIETILGRYGASSFAYMWQGTTALILFEYNGKRIKFMLRLPSRDDKAIKCTPERGTVRSREAQEKAYKQAVRQKWRALTFVIKAKLEAVESGISVFEEEFMANIVLPNGQTTGEYMLPQINEAYRLGEMPPMLPMLNGGVK
jgi:hypothetical protein